jgi:hypothetical protein
MQMLFNTDLVMFNYLFYHSGIYDFLDIFLGPACIVGLIIYQVKKFSRTWQNPEFIIKRKYVNSGIDINTIKDFSVLFNKHYNTQGK